MFRRMAPYQTSLLSASAGQRLAYVAGLIAVLFLCVVWAVSIP